jgi:HAD superfamily 5'-nucleotidase-like hydrolase
MKDFQFEEQGLDTDLEMDIDHLGMRRIYCNRDLNLAGIQWVGFDMDYTLAIYRRKPFDELTWELTAKRLIQDFGYPKALLDEPYDGEFAIRGLVIDKELGHVLKMNVFRHVGKGVHGRRPLTDEERSLYRNNPPPISSQRFRLLDTLFEIPEAYIYANIVQLFERRSDGEDVPYARIAADVRQAIDTIHADGTLKDVIVQDPGKYIERDPQLASALHRLRSAGKKLFLLTNSWFPYSQAVLSWLLDDQRNDYPDWRSYFDVVITAAQKPLFFRGSNPFMLLDDEGQHVREEHERFEKGKVYANGNLKEFESFIGLGGDEILYVGDHIFGDILRSKIDSNWRTVMIIPELEDELASTEMIRDVSRAWHDAQLRLNDVQHEIEVRSDAIARLRALLKTSESDQERRRIDKLMRPLIRRVDALKKQSRSILQRTFEYEDQFDEAFHDQWGALMKEGNEFSLFGSQVDQFACVYTSRASNLSAYSPNHYFRSPPQSLPHESLRR